MTNSETLADIMESDIAGRFNISRKEAQRIAEKARGAATAWGARDEMTPEEREGERFMHIWENEDWWVEGDQSA